MVPFLPFENVVIWKKELILQIQMPQKIILLEITIPMCYY